MNWDAVTISVFGQPLSVAQALALLGGACFLGFTILAVLVAVAVVSLKRE